MNPSPVIWDGGGDGIHWLDADNWNTDALPTSLNDVYISNVNPVLLNGSAAVNSLIAMGDVTIDGNLAIAAYSIVYGQFELNGGLAAGAGASLHIAGAAALDAAIILDTDAELVLGSGAAVQALDGTSVTGPGLLRLTDDAILTADGELQVENLVLESQATLQGEGTVTITHAMTWTGGKMIGEGTTLIADDATLTIPDGYNSLVVEAGRTLRNEGTVDWQGGNQISTNTGTARYENAEGATWTLGGNGVLYADEEGTQFVNEGLLEKTGTVGMMWDASVFDGVELISTGEIEVNAGVVRLDSGGGNRSHLGIG